MNAVYPPPPSPDAVARISAMAGKSRLHWRTTWARAAWSRSGARAAAGRVTLCTSVHPLRKRVGRPPDPVLRQISKPVETFDEAGNRYVVRSEFHYTESQGDELQFYVGTFFHHLTLQDGALRMILKRVNLLNCDAALPAEGLWARGPYLLTPSNVSNGMSS